jgi:hypothetical protein
MSPALAPGFEGPGRLKYHRSTEVAQHPLVGEYLVQCYDVTGARKLRSMTNL